MLMGTVLYIHLLIYAGLSLFIKSGLYIYMVVCIVYAHNLTTKQPLCCDKSSPFISKSSCVFHKTLHFKNPHAFSQNTSFYINKLNTSNYKNLFILLIYVSLHKKYQRPSCVFFHKTLHFKNPQVFSQNTTFHIRNT